MNVGAEAIGETDMFFYLDSGLMLRSYTKMEFESFDTSRERLISAGNSQIKNQVI